MMSIDPGVLIGLTATTFFAMIVFDLWGLKTIGGISFTINIICVILLLFKASEMYDKQQPLRDSEAVYAEYVTDILKSYGYIDIETKYDLSSYPNEFEFDYGYSPVVSATGIGDPDFTEMYHMMKVLNDYQDEENGYLFDQSEITITFHGERGSYHYFGEELGITYFTKIYSRFKLNDHTGEWIPQIPIRGMGEAQVYQTLLGQPTSVCETDEGTSYTWVTGDVYNYEAIAANGHISCVRMLTRQGAVHAEDIAKS